jgi:hypothetical protein
MHLELADELPTIDKVRGLIADAEAMTGQSITLADLARATREAVTNHANNQAGNALDIMREALSIYERTDINDKTQSARQMGRMQSALDTLQKMDALRL